MTSDGVSTPGLKQIQRNSLVCRVGSADRIKWVKIETRPTDSTDRGVQNSLDPKSMAQLSPKYSNPILTPIGGTTSPRSFSNQGSGIELKIHSDR